MSTNKIIKKTTENWNFLNELIPQMMWYAHKEKATIRKCIENCKKQGNNSVFCKAKCFKPPEKQN